MLSPPCLALAFRVGEALNPPHCASVIFFSGA